MTEHENHVEVAYSTEDLDPDAILVARAPNLDVPVPDSEIPVPDTEPAPGLEPVDDEDVEFGDEQVRDQ